MSDKPTFRFLEEAEADFHEGLRFYVRLDRAVAERFDQLIKRTTARIVESPLRWPIKNGYRRYVLPRFPYTIAYRFDARSSPSLPSPITIATPNPDGIVGVAPFVTLAISRTCDRSGCSEMAIETNGP